MEKKASLQRSVDNFFPRTVVNERTGAKTILITEPANDNVTKLFKCEKCPKTFGNRGAMQTHVNIKHKEKSFQPRVISAPHAFVARKFPKPFWKVAISHLTAGIAWAAVFDYTFGRTTFVPYVPPPTKKPDGRKGNKGSEKRNRYSIIQKAFYIEEYQFEKELDPTLSQDAFALIRPFSQGTFSEWYSSKDTIIEQAAQKTKKKLFKVRPVGALKFPAMDEKLYEEYKKRRAEGRRCSANWFRFKAKMLVKSLYPGASFSASNGWFMKFLRRHNLVLRKRTNKKRRSAKEREGDISNFHINLRVLLGSNGGAVKDPKWGRFPPKNRYNFDQVPLPFVIDLDDTYEERGADRVWIRQNAAGMDKRFCTLQLCFRPGYDQMKPTIIFRGQGQRITQVEKRLWDPRVTVMWQPKAWADREFSNAWAREHLCPTIATQNPGEECIAFCDNLDSQITKEFLNTLKSVSCFRFLLPPDATEYTQPVDQGLGRNLKVIIQAIFEEWLELEDNLDKWEHGKIAAFEKRILITQFVGEAWERMFQPGKYNSTSYFEKTGCLLTLDGSEDDKVKIDGLPDYKPPALPENFAEMVQKFDLDQMATQQIVAPDDQPDYDEVDAEQDLFIEDEEIEVQGQCNIIEDEEIEGQDDLVEDEMENVFLTI